MKHILAALLLVSPAAAQSVDPVVYGRHFCLLRAMKVDNDAARKAAVSYAFDPNRPAHQMSRDASAAADYVIENCRELAR